MEDDFDQKNDSEDDFARQAENDDAQISMLEPSDDEIEALREAWIDEPSPEEHWEAYLVTTSEPDRVQQLLEALVALRCNKGELIEALISVKTTDFYGSATRRRLLKFAEVVHQARELEPLSIGDKFSNGDWVKLQDLIGRYEDHLRAEAERAKRRPDRARSRALIALMQLVNKMDG